MHCGKDDSPPYVNSYIGVYSSSIASSASSSSASVWSDASQLSDDSSITSASSDSDSTEHCCPTQPPPSFQSTSNSCEQGISIATYWPKHRTSAEVAPEPRHPRRSSSGSTTRTGCPPSLLRQSDRKVNFVDNLVGKILLCILTSTHAQ
jgi:hypothetical protein